MADPVVTVVAHARVRGWPPEEGHKTAPRVSQLPLSEALTRQWATDAHIQLGVSEQPHRLRKTAWDFAEVEMRALFVDVDGHDEADIEAWWQLERAKVVELFAARPGGFCYRTRGGYRLVYRVAGWKLTREESAETWARGYFLALIELAMQFKIVGDPSCADWTRLFRLPHATRDRKVGPEQLEVIGDPQDLALWKRSPQPGEFSMARELAKTYPAWESVGRRLMAPAVDPPPSPKKVVGCGGETPRAKAALEGECEAVRCAGKGGRNRTLNAAAVKLGHLVHAGELDESTVVRELENAARAAGLERDDGKGGVLATIRSGLAFGRKSPPKHEARVVVGGAPPPAKPSSPKPAQGGGDGGRGSQPVEPTAEATDAYNAEQLLDMHGRDLLYCEPLGGWHAWDGKRYRIADCGEPFQRALDCVRKMYAAARADEAAARKREHKARQDGDKDAEAKAHGDLLAASAQKGWAKRSHNHGKLIAMLAIASTDARVRVAPESVDANPFLLSVDNGTLDLKSGELKPHRREDRITRLAPVKFNSRASAPRWTAFLEEVFGTEASDLEVVGFVQRHLGSALTGVVRDEVAVFYWGGGANGKTTMLNAIAAVLGDYYREIDSEMLLARDVSSSKIDAEKASLKGVRLAVCAETRAGRTLDDGVLKQISSNNRIVGKRLYANPIEFDPTHKAVLMTNAKPRVKATDDGTWRRIRLVPFLRTFPKEHRDAELGRKLKAEGSGILSWLLEGCLAWQKWGLGDASRVEQATEEYRLDQDLVRQFVDDRCELDPGSVERAKELYEGFKRWSEDEGVARPPSQKVFGSQLGQVGGVSRGPLRDGRKTWQGIRVLTDIELEARRSSDHRLPGGADGHFSQVGEKLSDNASQVTKVTIDPLLLDCKQGEKGDRFKEKFGETRSSSLRSLPDDDSGDLDGGDL